MLQWEEIRKNFIGNVYELMWCNNMTEEMTEIVCGLQSGFFVELLYDEYSCKPSEEELEKIADYFDTTIEELCEQEPDSKTENGYVIRRRRLVKVVTAGCNYEVLKSVA